MTADHVSQDTPLRPLLEKRHETFRPRVNHPPSQGLSSPHPKGWADERPWERG